MSNYRIAAAIPTHNRPDQLKEAIESVRGQSVPVEIVVVDDGSAPPVTRDSVPDDVVFVRHSQPRGPASARNTAVDATTAEWIAYLDDDDRWLPGKAEALLNAIEEFKDATVVFNHMAYRPSRRKARPRRVVDPMGRVLYQQPPHLSGVAVRRDIHARVRFDESMWATQDLDYLIRLADGGVWIEIPRVLGLHASDTGSSSAIDRESRVAGRLSLLDRHGELICRDRRAHSFFYTRLGHQYRRADRLDASRASFLRALKLRPTNMVAWRGLTRLLIRRR